MTKFLVTGASGYIALHIIDRLLKEGHQVRGTVRNLKDEKKIEPIQKLFANSKYPLELVEADLLNTDSWTEILKDIDILMHVASPIMIENPANEEEVI